MTVDVASSVKKMFVDGKWIDSESGKYFIATSPATGATIAQVPRGTRAEARGAVPRCGPLRIAESPSV